ncbi:MULTISPECIES: spore germination protein [unclassified Paenibacillus]|uniref:spore germination protein n=1 Tax=unclassified Paenibacillus TaxID=185978 RepID=UPI0009541BBE|nr:MULTISPECIES: spore germination protein [unclassified Paenibacillus]ASS65612.1 spore germination protein [Paenibacillus sp. RUD330]SIQ29817.1 spore germination protein KA [Paenibacillus sp. RU4X]SIQ51805.1 spore germination protein KA [Paenibacillus sp. RU4T]
MKGWAKLKKYVVADLSNEPSKSFSLGSWEGDGESQAEPPSSAAALPLVPPLLDKEGNPLLLHDKLEENVAWLKRHFSYPLNSGLIFRSISLGKQSRPGMVVYLDSLIEWQHLSRTVISPLVEADLPEDEADALDMAASVFTNGEMEFSHRMGDIADAIVIGSAVVLVDGAGSAGILDVEGMEKRALEAPKTENVVLGPQVGFTEDIRTNISLIRRRLSTPDLIVESGVAGSLSRTRISFVYLKSIANEELVNEVRRRIAAIDIDYIGDSGMVEQLIEDHPNSIYPGILSTERPDRTAAQLADGFVGILVDNSPFALIVPAQFPLFLQTAEDAYLRWHYSTFLRIVRTVGFFMSLYLPALYVAIANYHHEMIPTTLVLAIAGTRESVPLPVSAEAFLLESMFELIREAGVRIPSVIGPTIGIVGALILGQAAVQANIVSPIIVIITSATALASYTIPNYNMQFTTRILRFVYLACASFLGLVGVILLSIMLWTYWMSGNRFGVPSLSPLSPRRPSRDTLIRAPLKKQTKRPISIHPQDMDKIPDERSGDGSMEAAPVKGGDSA